MARPTKLNQMLQDKLVECIRQGAYYETACRCVGIGYRTFRTWMTKGEGESAGQYGQFRQAIKQAEAEAEIRLVELWQQQAITNWQAARDFLERRYPERWGRKDRAALEVSGPDGAPLEINVHDLLIAKLDEMAKKRKQEIGFE